MHYKYAKKYLYITLFTILGFLFQLAIHGTLEIFYGKLLFGNFERFSFGLSWETWFTIHTASAFALLVGGIIVGFFCGKYFWHLLYDGRGNLRKNYAHHD